MNPFSMLRNALIRVMADAKTGEELVAKCAALQVPVNTKLRVIGAGFPRTATMSMYAAFLTLGYKTFHGNELVFDRALADRWIATLEKDLKNGNADNVDWQDVLRGYEAGFDIPFCEYWLELANAFPEAKIVYTTRDGQTWYRSWKSVLGDPYLYSRWFGLAVFWVRPFKRLLKVEKLAMARAAREYGDFRPEVIDERLREIREQISPDRLLVFHPRDGWEPLCKFLDVPVPDEPFPNVNDSKSLIWMFNTVTIIGMSLWAITCLLICGALAAILYVAIKVR